MMTIFLGIDSYPTLKFRTKYDENWRSYDGPRNGPGILSFVDRMTKEVLLQVSSVAQLERLAEKSAENGGSGVIFVFCCGGLEDNTECLESARLFSKRLQDKIYFSLVTDGLEWTQAGIDGDVVEKLPISPFLAILEKWEQPRFYPGDILNKSTIDQQEAWVLRNDAPIMSELDSSNLQRMGKLGKLLVMAVTDPIAETTLEYLRDFKQIARTLTDQSEGTTKSKFANLTDKFVFGNLDASIYADLLQKLNINELPRIVVADRNTKSYYDGSEVDDLSKLEEFLVNVTLGKVNAVAMNEGRGFQDNFFLSNRYWVIAIVPFFKLIEWLASLLKAKTPIKQKAT